MSIYKRLLKAGIPLDNHESDLYAKVTEESERIIKTYEFKENVTRFTSNIDGQRWFDIPFAFDPFWEKKVK